MVLIKKFWWDFVNHDNPLSANITKWSNTLKQFVGNLPTNCLSMFDHFVGLALKGLTASNESLTVYSFCVRRFRFVRNLPTP